MSNFTDKIKNLIPDNNSGRVTPKNVRESFDVVEKKIDSTSSGFQFSISPATPEPEGGWLKGIYPVIRSGTYPNQNNIEVNLEDGYVGLIFDGENWSKMILPLDSQLKSSVEESRNFQIAKNIDDYEQSQLISFDAGNFYLDFEGVEQTNSDCVITEMIECLDLSHIIPYCTTIESAYNWFYDSDGVPMLSGRFQVTEENIGKKIPVPYGASKVKLCSFTDVIEIPVAILVGERQNEALKSGLTAQKDISSFTDTWTEVASQFIKIAMPNVDYSNGYFFDFDVNVTDIRNTDSGKDDSTLNLKINILAYPTIQKCQITTISGKPSLITSAKLMKDASGVLCIVFNRSEWLNIYRYEVSNVKVFASEIRNEKRNQLTTITVSNIANITGYTEIYDFTQEIYSINPIAGKSVLLTGTSITAGYDDGAEKDYYPDYVKEIFQTNIVTKYGLSGGTLAVNSSWAERILSDARLSEIVESAPQIIIIEGGINDYQLNIPVGDINSDRTTTVGALKYAIEYLKTNLPNVIILYTTSGGYFYALSGTRHSGRVVNTQGKTAYDYFKSCIDLCKQYSIPTLDFYSECGWYDANEQAGNYNWTSDGLHFSKKTYKKWVEMEKDKLKSVIKN